jgi:hypothetical protein
MATCVKVSIFPDYPASSKVTVAIVLCWGNKTVLSGYRFVREWSFEYFMGNYPYLYLQGIQRKTLLPYLNCQPELTNKLKALYACLKEYNSVACVKDPVLDWMISLSMANVSKTFKQVNNQQGLRASGNTRVRSQSINKPAGK